MSTNIQTASAQYASRPKDERMPSLAALVQAAEYDRDHSKERDMNLRDLIATPVDAQGRTLAGKVMLTNRATGLSADFTHWSFGQLARTIGAPAAYLRALPPQIAADALNYGLGDAAHTEGKRINLLLKANGGTPVVRAATSDTYSRVWDAELYGQLNRHFGDGMKSSQGEWQSPPTWLGEPAGQYRGDRDSFVIRIDGGSIVGDPRGFSGGGNGRLNRAILVRNSEVGHCSVTLECILFDFICGNHILWGAVVDGKAFRRRHVGTDVAGKAITEMLKIARRYNERTASQDEAIIKALCDHEIAHTKEAVIDELKKLGYTKEQATEAYATCEAKDPQLNPRSFWGIASGTTRNSQEAGYQDDRLNLDQMAAQLLRKGAIQYATV